MPTFLFPLNQTPSETFGQVMATTYHGRENVQSGVIDILLHSPHSSALAFAAMTNQQQPWVSGYALHGTGPRDFWSAALIVTPSMSFLSPAPDAALPDIVDVIMSMVAPGGRNAIPMCTEASMTAPLLKAWAERTGEVPHTANTFDYYLHHDGVMADIPSVQHPYRMTHATKDNLAQTMPLVCEIENGLPTGVFNLLSAADRLRIAEYYQTDFEDRQRFIWLDEADRGRAAVTVVQVGVCGAFLSKFQQTAPEGLPHEADPQAAFAEIAQATQALHQQGRWVGIVDSAANPNGLFARTVRDVGFEKVGVYHYSALPYPAKPGQRPPSPSQIQ